MAVDGNIRRTVQKTIATSNATLATAVATQDTACTTAMNAIITGGTNANPGLVDNSQTLGPLTLFFDGTNYVAANAITFTTLLPS